MKNDVDIEEPTTFCPGCGQQVTTDAGGNPLQHTTKSGDVCEKKEMDLTEFYNYMKSMIDEFIVYWLANEYPRTLDLPDWVDQFETYVDLKQQGSIS